MIKKSFEKFNAIQKTMVILLVLDNNDITVIFKKPSIFNNPSHRGDN